MASQKQKIDNSSIKNSIVWQLQAGKNLIVLSLFGKPEPPQVDWDWGMKLLENKQSPEICQRLTDTLGSDRTLMDVSIEDQPHWVNRPLQADRVLQIDGKDCGALNADKMLIEAFRRDDIGGKLLILGAPGAGKTTELLSLAQQLVEEAISNSETMIPVIFELSTWRDDSQSIESWLIKQLCNLDGNNRKTRIYEQWLERQVLLPLLDGLDELGLERQKKCIEKLNEFAERYPKLVVCCRVKEFATADIMLPNLKWAVCLQPLSNLRIKHYFNSIERPELGLAIQVDPSLQSLMKETEHGEPGLLQIPLFVKLMAGVGIYTQRQSISSKSDLLNQYIDEQLSPKKRNADRHKGSKKSNWAYKEVTLEPNNNKTRSHLIWLANNVKNNDGGIEFLIEHMQPSWLNSDRNRYWYRFIFGFILFLFWIPFSLWLSTSIPPAVPFLSSLKVSLLLSPIISSIGGLCFGYAKGLTKIEPVESFEFPTSKWIWKEFKNSVIFGLIVGFLSWLAYTITHGILPRLSYDIIIEGFVYSLASVMVSTIIGFIATQKQGLKERLRPNQGIWKSLQNSLWSIIPFAFPMLLLLMRFPGNTSRFLALIVTLQCSFQVGGGMAWLQHFSLRIVLWLKGLPWDLARFLKYCEERKLIQSVGGRYRFLHRELLDHFASPNH